MSMFDGLADAMKSVPPANLSFTVDEINVIINALSSYREQLEKDLDNPDLPVFSGYNGINDSDTCDSVKIKFINYYFK